MREKQESAWSDSNIGKKDQLEKSGLEDVGSQESSGASGDLQQIQVWDFCPEENNPGNLASIPTFGLPVNIAAEFFCLVSIIR